MKQAIYNTAMNYTHTYIASLYNTIQYEVFRAPNSQTQQRDGGADYYSVAR